MIHWEEHPEIPKGVAAILSGRSPENEADLQAARAYADRFQLTLALHLPGADLDRKRNQERNRRVLDKFQEILRATAAFEIVVLKGFTHANLFHLEPADRVQYDLDLFAPSPTAKLRSIVAEFSAGSRNYTWNGDYYDPEMPVFLDFHEKLWNQSMEGFPAPGSDEFWTRRIWMEAEGLRFQTLSPPDALGFAALHMLKHILHGDARPMHAYEIASFLRHHPESADTFWDSWRRLHPPELRLLEAISFRFAAEWFGAEAPREAKELPPPVEQWFARYAASPILAFFRPNKDELTLNLHLIQGNLAKARVAARRLFPLQWPRPFSYALARGAFHLRALLPTVSTMFRMRR